MCIRDRHVDCVRRIGLKTFTERYKAFCKKHHYIFQQDKPEKLFNASKELVAVFPKEKTYKLLIPVSYTHLIVEVEKEKFLNITKIEPNSSQPRKMFDEEQLNELANSKMCIRDRYRTVPGLENVKIVRNAYAIEYDCINSRQLKASLEFKNIEGLFSGGQFNGSSGYEEAAVQGFMAEMCIRDRSHIF